MTGCRITCEELSVIGGRLKEVSAEIIAEAVAAPPETWNITYEERITVAQYLAVRRDQLLAAITA